MTVLVLFLAILGLVVLITWGKVHAFPAFLVVALVTGLALGIPPGKIAGSLQKGMGDTLGGLVMVIVLGAMLGKLVAASGAAQQISAGLTTALGKKYILWVMLATGFIVGIPLFYNVGFVLLVPLAFSIAGRLQLPAVYVGLPMLASLSVTHGFLPPHPSPVALVTQFNAHMGLTLLYGIIVAIPVVVLAGPFFAQTLSQWNVRPPDIFVPKLVAEDRLPGFANSLLTALLPVLLLALTTLLQLFNAPATPWLQLLSDPSVVMLLSLMAGTITLGTANGYPLATVMKWYAEGARDVAVILLIIAGAGALKQVLADSGVSASIAGGLRHLSLHPLVTGWLMAAIIRVAMGSATIAGLTTAGILAPVLPQMGVNPNLMVLSVGAGSLMFSHVNDAGFWMFKEYFNLSLSQTFRSWTVMETIVSVAGLAGVLLLNQLL